MNLFQLWIAAHASHTLQDYLIFALGGLMGAAGYSAAAVPKWTLPRVEDGQIELGIVGVLIAGMVLALIVDYALPLSLIAGTIGAPGIVMVNKLALKFAALRISAGGLDEPVAKDNKP